MKLHIINAGFFKLDGGAMFGVVPKSIWQKTNPADENNLCTWALRCLLIEDGNKLILIDNGIGDKQDQSFFRHYFMTGSGVVGSLKEKGFSPDDITDMFLTHLHFDHCGGSVRKEGEKLSTVFRNATYWSNELHWNWAVYPNKREKASFLKENILPMKESGQLKMIDTKGPSPIRQFDILFVSGHTEAMMLPVIKYNEHTIVYVADLIPSSSHIPIPYVMGYDTRPLLTMDEKEKLLETAADKNYILFYEHDPVNECTTVKRTEKGIRLDRAFPLSDLG